MSRIPRAASSPDRAVPNPVTLKRKASDDENPVPPKISATAGRVLKPSLASNVNLRATSIALSRPLQPLTRLQPNIASTVTQRNKRSVSAPPVKLGYTTNSLSKSTSLKSAKLVNKLGTVQDEEISQIESARAANIAKVCADMDVEREKAQELQTFHHQLSKQLAESKSQEIEQRRHLMNVSDELDEIKKKHAREILDLEFDKAKLQRELRDSQEELRLSRVDLEREREASSVLKNTIFQQTTTQMTLQAQVNALQATNSSLNASLAVANSLTGNVNIKLEQATSRVAELEQELREAETLRRKLHNMVQELKGNIRVFCRVRPSVPSDKSFNPDESKALLANIDYPDQRDHREIVLNATSESATGAERKEVWNFEFDRVFGPESTQVDVFEEISQLTQSCVDGYNVCIFAYGSGKSFTMEGGSTPEATGVIPRAVEKVFNATYEQRSKGWVYKLEGQFLEIYNETINDLLGNGELDKKKHEIRHDKATTRVTDVVVDQNKFVAVVPLETPSQVRNLLSRAQSRRSIAATLMNERSSRSHSVFTLRISGNNPLTKESCEGSLNLVDLAGSERLNSSGAGKDKERLKETQNINRSLSALGDVIAALGNAPPGQGDKHIPYRNSKASLICLPFSETHHVLYSIADISTAKFIERKFKNVNVLELITTGRPSQRVSMLFALRNEGQQHNNRNG
ncbi:hypothetical protein Clacol_005571 [Clathrus columnatus]|uniref:Kinesin-like protein n=1 Tax=Clathrus columnatus TaxID=1419009 RepID=A0AAV5A9R1_9AGAM|nr:hypothetical protein Clacol_005571 [Clathrus columnatus]